jgi:hypothetical protein
MLSDKWSTEPGGEILCGGLNELAWIGKCDAEFGMFDLFPEIPAVQPFVVDQVFVISSLETENMSKLSQSLPSRYAVAIPSMSIHSERDLRSLAPCLPPITLKNT